MKERPILFSGPMVRAILSGRKTQTRRVVATPADGWEFDRKLGRVKSEHRHQGKFGAFIRRGVGTDFPEIDIVPCKYGQPGDRLWVKETFSTDAISMYPCPRAWYRATDFNDRGDLVDCDRHVCPKESRGRWADCLACWEEREGRKFRWRPSIFMRRELSRITLEIVSVRVERLQEISEGDAVAEGIHRFEVNDCVYFHARPTAPTEEHFNSAVMAYRDLWESINGAGSWDANPWVWVVEFKRI